MKTRKGSVLMEGVITLPLWLVIFAGVMRLGERAVDYERIKGADVFAAVNQAGRGKFAGHPEAALNYLFWGRGTIVPVSDVTTAVKAENPKAFVAMTGARVQMTRNLVSVSVQELFDEMFNQPFIGYDGKSWTDKFKTIADSSRKGNTYSFACLTRNPYCTYSKRHWDAGKIYMEDIWDFDDGKYKDEFAYPANWTEKVLTDGKDLASAEQGKKDNQEKSVEKIYTRSEILMRWSGEARD